MSQQVYKNNILWSAITAGVVFGGLFAWMLYYAVTATEASQVAPRLLGMTIFRVQGITDGFEIGPEPGIIGVPICVGVGMFAISIIARKLGQRVTRGLPK